MMTTTTPQLLSKMLTITVESCVVDDDDDDANAAKILDRFLAFPQIKSVPVVNINTTKACLGIIVYSLFER